MFIFIDKEKKRRITESYDLINHAHIFQRNH